MISWIKKYWLELLAFGGIFAVLLIDCAPDYTWINTCSDGVHYTYSAHYLMPSHKSSAPLYLLLAHAWYYLPIGGTEFWRLALISVMATFISCVFIYLIVRKQTGNRYIGLVSSLIYGSSALVISQGTIVETYPLVVMFCIISYYFVIKEKWITASVFIGCAGAVHPIAMMFIIPVLIWKKELRTWRRLGIMALFVLFYLYIPLTNRPPYMWTQPNSSGILGFMNDTYQTARMLSSGLSIWDLPKRVIDTILQLVLNWNLGIVALIIYFVRSNIKWYKDILFWLIALPIVYYVVDLAPQTYVYIQPAIAFGCVGIGIGLTKIPVEKYLEKYKNIKVELFRRSYLSYGIAVCSVGLLVFNANYFDIGRTLDPNLSAVKFWKELDKIPNGDTLMAQQGWEWAMVYKYNADYDRKVKVVCVGTLTSPAYQRNLMEMGVNVLDMPDVDLGNRPNAMAKWICENNDNVWITKVTDASTYGSEVVPARINGVEYTDNINLLNDSYSTKSIVDGSRDLEWSWKPSNPYDITTGAIEVKEWRWIIFSNYNCLMFGMLTIISVVPIWIIWQIVVKKKQWKFSNAKKAVKL